MKGVKHEDFNGYNPDRIVDGVHLVLCGAGNVLHHDIQCGWCVEGD
jgi:hypothetical protein